MELLKTIAAPNTLQSHGLNHIAIYADPTVSLYRKNPATNEIILQKTWTLAGVKRLALSDSGKILTAQTATQTHRLSTEGQSPFDVVGVIGSADADYSVVLTPTAVQVIRDTVVNMTATLNSTHKVVCGPTTFVVYNSVQSILGSYTAGLQAPVAQAKSLLHVTHVAKDNFAFFYSDGTVTYRGKTRTLNTLKKHRRSGQHVVANDGTYEWAYQTSHPLTYPEKVRPYVLPAIPNEMFISDTGGAPLTYTLTRTPGVEVEDPPPIGNATISLPPDNQDALTVVLDQVVNLSTNDWTLEWSTFYQTAIGGSYYAEVALLPADSSIGITARFGDGGYSNRMQFGGRVDQVATNYNVSLTKSAVYGTLKKFSLVKRGSTISVFVDNIKQSLASGTSQTYNLGTFPVDTDLSAIKRVVLGAQPWGGGTIGSLHGPVKLTLGAARPPFSIFNPDGTLYPGITNTGGTVANNLITLATNQYLSMPDDPTLVPRTRDFSVEYEVLLTAVSPTVAGSALQPFFYWGSWANPAQQVNMESFYSHTAPTYIYFSISHASPNTQYASAAYTLNLNQWYNIKWVRTNGMMNLYIDGTLVTSMAFAHDVTYDVSQPIVFGRRKGGSTGEVLWYSNMRMRKFAITIL